MSYITTVPWASSNGPWDIANVHPLSHGTLCVAHGPYFSWITCVPWACSDGPWDISKMFTLCPMGHFVLPMGLTFPGSHVSHGHVPLDHGTLCVAHGPDLSWITCVPWACTNGPWDISNVQPLSHGRLYVAHGPVLSCITTVPWASSNGPQDIANVHPLSHGRLYVAHGPVLSCITTLPWASSNGPWDIENVHPLSHGKLYVAHGPSLSWITCVPWACSNGPWDTPMGCCMLPMVLSCPASPLSHGQVPMDHGT